MKYKNADLELIQGDTELNVWRKDLFERLPDKKGPVINPTLKGALFNENEQTEAISTQDIYGVGIKSVLLKNI